MIKHALLLLAVLLLSTPARAGLENHSDNDDIDVGDKASFGVEGAFSLYAVVTVHNANISNSPFLVAKGGGAGNRGWGIQINSNNTINLFVSDDGSVISNCSSTATVPYGAPINIVGVFNPSTAQRVWINGTVVSDCTASIPSNQFNASANLYLGFRDSAAGTNLSGTFEEFTMYNVALTNAEAFTLSTTTVKGMPFHIRPNDRVIHYLFDEFPEGATAAGTESIRDQSAYGNHGTPENGLTGRADRRLSRQ